MDEIEIRKQAISRYENGESPKAIYQSLGKSKRWFFKWLKRYKYDGENWSKDLSRKPHRTREKINETMEQAIIDTRKKLESTLYAQIGALNIKWHLAKQGLEAVPFQPLIKYLNEAILCVNATNMSQRALTIRL